MPAAEPRKKPIRDTRLDVRISRETKALCERAAAIQGRNLTDFVVSSVVDAARQVVRERELADLTRQDRMAFVEALLNPPAPNARLRAAAKRYEQVFGS